MEHEFYRIRHLPSYIFAEINPMKTLARAAGGDIIDFGIGNLDTPTPGHIVDKTMEAIRYPKPHRHSNSRGIPGSRKKAQAAYCQRRFGVVLDPEGEIIVILGSKEGLANLASAISNPGDIMPASNPNCPIHLFRFIIAGASAHGIPITPGHDPKKTEQKRAICL